MVRSRAVDWEAIFGYCDRRLRSSDIRALLEITERSQIISFGGGLPAPELFPVDAVAASVAAVLENDGPGALQYGPTPGYWPLRELIAAQMRSKGCANVSAENVVVTTGSQQGLDLLGQILVRPQAHVFVESPTYVGALQAFSMQAPHYHALEMDAEGLRSEELASSLRGLPPHRRTPALLYTIPSFQNPSGRLMSAARRREILRLCRDFRVPLVEDDPYGELYYDERPPAPIRSLPNADDVIYCGTMSKVLSPGIRVGWVVGPPAVVDRLGLAKQGADLHSNSLIQRVVWHLYTNADMSGHVEALRATYRLRRNAMLAALDEYLPAEEVTWTKPAGGMFLWVTFPEGTDARQLLTAALDAGFAFVPGSAFHPTGRLLNSARFNFSNANEAQIDCGIARLGAVYKKARARAVVSAA